MERTLKRGRVERLDEGGWGQELLLFVQTSYFYSSAQSAAFLDPAGPPEEGQTVARGAAGVRLPVPADLDIRQLLRAALLHSDIPSMLRPTMYCRGKR